MSGSSHLGLEIMRSRAQRMGGQLEVSLNDGGGTRVWLLIPTLKAASVAVQ